MQCRLLMLFGLNYELSVKVELKLVDSKIMFLDFYHFRTKPSVMTAPCVYEVCLDLCGGLLKAISRNVKGPKLGEPQKLSLSERNVGKDILLNATEKRTQRILRSTLRKVLETGENFAV